MKTYPPHELERIRRSRRHPRPTQFDYLHVRTLLTDLGTTLDRVARPGDRVLDVYCGSRPYDDLLPEGARVIGLDVPGNPYGVADIVSDAILPFPDDSFDVVMCVQAFDYIPDSRNAVAEFDRVLRPGGTMVLTVPLVWEYDRTQPVHRYSGPDLASLFETWNDVEVTESGGRGVAWATLTGSLLSVAEGRVKSPRASAILHPVFALLYGVVNALGLGLHAGERRLARSANTLPMNLMLVARSAKRADAP